MKTSALVFGIGAALLIYGCSSSGSDNSSSSTASPGGSTTTGAAPAPSSSTTTTGGSAATTTSGAGSTASASAGYAAVQAIFNQSCMPCHSAQRPAAGLDLTSYDSVMKGGRTGAVVKAGDPAGSDLIAYLKGTKKPQMPKGKPPLADSDVKTITDWIQAGAKNN